MTDKIPQGFNTITSSLSVKGADEAIKLYTKAFGAKEESRMSCPKTGKIMHACLTIGDSKLFINDHMPESGCGDPTVSSFYLYLPDVDKSFKQARDAGLKEHYPVTDMFWGDRTGTVQDKFGNYWTLATHVRDVSPEELEEGAKKFAQKAA